MNDFFHKYFNGEMTDKEKKDFLSSVSQNPSLEKEFIEIQNLLGISNLLSCKNDIENARESLSEFLQERSNSNEVIQ